MKHCFNTIEDIYLKIDQKHNVSMYNHFIVQNKPMYESYEATIPISNMTMSSQTPCCEVIFLMHTRHQ